MEGTSVAATDSPGAGTGEASGYASPSYVGSLAEFGRPRLLPQSDGWLLQRTIDATPHQDAMGPYPMFFCRDWRELAGDLSTLSADLVSVVLVTDPFAAVDSATLYGCFDRVARFKDHYVARLDRTPQSIVSRSHRVNARRALRHVEVRVRDRPWEHLADWLGLFANLVRRHGIRGIRAFSPRAFELQLRVPGLVMFEASTAGQVVGHDLWYVQGDIAYGHLAAFSDLGYRVGASYATKWTMLEYFSGRAEWVDLSGTVGLASGRTGGLAHFKAGWATDRRPVYLCGRILQERTYQHLARRRCAHATSYFPEYRVGEFG